MTSAACLDPSSCPVPDPDPTTLSRLGLHPLEAGTTFQTSYHRAHWPPDLFNESGAGNARFSPLLSDRLIVPTLYGGRSIAVVLLETAFHDIHPSGTSIISEAMQLAPRGVMTLTNPKTVQLVDLTDNGPGGLGLARKNLVSTSPEHYACTREWAQALHEAIYDGQGAAGIVWNSRVAEIAEATSPLLADLLPRGSDVFVLFGDRVSTNPKDWLPGPPAYADLTSGQGRILADEVAHLLGAVIV